MKILIWVLSILITSIISVLIKSTGITLGAIPTMILYTPLFFIVPKLCKKWDDTQRSIQNFPPAITVTEMHNLEDHYRKFVKLAIPDLENPDTFPLRFSYSSTLIYSSRSISEEERKRILAKPITELERSTMRGRTSIKIEPISTIPASEYENNHYIYGILRKRPDDQYVLTNAFIDISDRNLQIISRALNAQKQFEYSLLDDGTISVFDISSDSIENLEIPEMIDGKVVSTISEYAFSKKHKLKTIKIPDTVKHIESHAFSECKQLESVFLGNGVVKLDFAFSSCEKLQKVHIGKSLSEVNVSFDGCHESIDFNIDPDNTHLFSNDGVLFSKDKMTLLVYPCGRSGKYCIPYGTKVIGESAFAESALEEIIIPNTVEKIEKSAFSWARKLKKLTVPSSVQVIASFAITGTPKFQVVVEQNSYAQKYFQEDQYWDPEYLVILNDTPSEPMDATPSDNKADNNIHKLFCRHCGTQLPSDSVFCFKCGTKVENDVI